MNERERPAPLNLHLPAEFRARASAPLPPAAQSGIASPTSAFSALTTGRQKWNIAGVLAGATDDPNTRVYSGVVRHYSAHAPEFGKHYPGLFNEENNLQGISMPLNADRSTTVDVFAYNSSYAHLPRFYGEKVVAIGITDTIATRDSGGIRTSLSHTLGIAGSEKGGYWENNPAVRIPATGAIAMASLNLSTEHLATGAKAQLWITPNFTPKDRPKDPKDGSQNGVIMLSLSLPLGKMGL